MQLVDTSLNHLRSNAAVTLRTAADSCNLIMFFNGPRHSRVKPTVGVIGHPAMLTVDRGNPDAGLFSAMNNQQRPLGFEAFDVEVTNGDGVKGVDHDKVFFSKHQLGSEPQANRGDSNHRGHGPIADWVFASNWVEQKLSNKQGVEGKSAKSPNQVAFGSENLDIIHFSIIAAQTVSKEGTQK